MPINDSCELVLRDLYFYDFRAAYPRILKRVGWKFGDEVDLDNKAQRNIMIGLAQRDNKELSDFLMNSVKSLLQFYLDSNDLTESDVIVTQRDGFIITKLLKKADEFLELDFRGGIDLLIITPDRKKHLLVFDNKVDVKGISNRYPDLDQIYQKFMNFNFYNKKILFKQLQNIKDYVLQCEDKKLFMVEVDEKYVIQTLKHGQLVIAGEEFFEIQDIDRQKYYDHYFREFVESIFLQFY